MTLFESATELRVRLKSADEAHGGEELLSRARTVREDIRLAAEHFEAVQSYRETIGGSDTPVRDAVPIREAIEIFEGALASSGLKAVQQPSGATLLRVVASQTRLVDRWVRSTWRANFAMAHGFLVRANSDRLHGSAAARRKVRDLVSTIEDVWTMNPVSDRAALEERLERRGLHSCVERVNELIEELRTAIAASEQEQSERTPEVQAALRRAASDEGLPLAEVTPELLAALQSAGVLDDLVVRRL